nr:uncharacterized protein LOC110379359 [Helicoverpa armigera]
MTDTRDYHHHPSSVFSTDTMKLASSASEQNVYFTYVCLVNDIKPGGTFNPKCGLNEKTSQDVIDISSAHNEEVNQEDQPIQVERSKALHELVESYKKAEQADQNETDSSTPYPTTTSGDDSELSEIDECNFIPCDNPNVLKLTKMKWLTEDTEDGPDSSSPSISPTTSSSNCSKVSEDEIKEDVNGLGDKYLSTILRLDKEHNMFGLSNIAIVGAKPSKMKRKDDDRPVFHQTAIVQICCGKGCCKYKSNTDLPLSLKGCGGCRGCCADPCCTICVPPCTPPSCVEELPPCSLFCSSCPRGKCSCKYTCKPSKCTVDCSNCFGLKIKLNRKPKYEAPAVELTPRASCELQKPLAARSCHHLPQCIPPSSCFPYLMPCFWPARPSAPCTSPARCFHNPPCPAARKRARVSPPREYICPKKCVDEQKQTKCDNDICPGNNLVLRRAIENRFGMPPPSS